MSYQTAPSRDPITRQLAEAEARLLRASAATASAGRTADDLLALVGQLERGYHHRRARVTEVPPTEWDAPAGARPAVAVPDAGDHAAPSNRRVMFDIIAQVAGRIGNLALGVVATFVLVRQLGETRFGQWSTIFAVVQLGTSVVELGLYPIAVSRAAADRRNEGSWIGSLVALRALLAIPGALISFAIILALAHSGSMVLAGAMASALLLAGIPAVMTIVFQLRTRNDVPILTTTINSVLWTAAVVAIAASGGGLVAFAAAMLACQAVTTVLLAVLAVRALDVPLHVDWARAKELARVGLPLGLGGILTLAFVRIDQILLFELAGPADAGVYGGVYRLLDQAQFIPTALMTTLFPMIAAARRADPARMHLLIARALDFLAVLSLPALAISLSAPGAILEFLFGPGFGRGAAALPILMGAFVLVCFCYLAENLIVVFELQSRYLKNAAAALVFNLVLNVLLIPKYGLVAAAWVTLATQALVLVLATQPIVKYLPARLPIGRLLRALACTAVSAAAGNAAHRAGAPLGAVLALTATLYAFGLVATRALDLRELKDLAGKPAAGA